MRAIADKFMENAGDEGEGFGVVQAHAASESALGEGAGLCDEELVDLEIMISRWRFGIGKVDWGFLLYLFRCQLHCYSRDGSYVRETAEDVT